jgi:glycosyltransferase involved in cell wall biosynthesis
MGMIVRREAYRCWQSLSRGGIVASRMSERDFLFVQSTTEVGGAESALLNLFTASEELRRRSVIASLGFGDGDLPNRLREVGAEVVELPRARLREPLGLVRTLWTLRGLVRSRGVQVVVGNGAHPQIIGGAAARLSGARSVFLVNMIHAAPLSANDPRDALALRGPCDLMLAISQASKDTLERVRPDVETRLFYWGTPVRDVPAADARAARAELGAADGDMLVGVFGRLQRWKGQDVFVEAAAEVARARPRTRFAVVGGSVFGLEPEFAEGLRARVRERGLEDRVVFTGFRTDVPRLMAACDVVCHTTRVAEPFGLVVIEAMSLARPVIATRGGGPSEIIQSDEMGLLVSSDDAGALARAIVALADDPERRQAMGTRAAARVRSAFTIDLMATNLLRHLDSVRN